MAGFLFSRLLMASGLVVGSVACGVACGADVSARPCEGESAGEAVRPRVKEGFAGRVVDESGRSVEGALIMPRSLQAAGPPIPELAVLSDPAGCFQWALPAGSYEVLVTAEGHRAARVQTKVAKGKVTPVDVVLRQER